MPRWLAVQSILRRHHTPFWNGVVESCRVDETEGMASIRIESHEYWFPLSALEGEVDIRREYAACCDLSPVNGHRYFYGTCSISESDIVVDAGACEGFFVRLALTKGAGTVIAIEPSKRMCNCLERTFEREIKSGQVVVRHLCLGETRGIVHMSGIASHPFGLHREIAATDFETLHEAPMDTLDSILSLGCDFLKMDIEGSEVPVLQNCRTLPQHRQLRMAVTTYHLPGDANTLFDLISRQLPDHKCRLDGIRWPGGKVPRPMMLYAWPR
jgi:FkbM family methyltransferase